MMRVTVAMAAGVVLSATLASCAQSHDDVPVLSTTRSDLRSLTNDEAKADFAELVSDLRGLWGARERKEARYNFNFDDYANTWTAKIAAAQETDDYEGLFRQFLAGLHDVHLYFGPTQIVADDIVDVSLPFAVIPIENTYVVDSADASLNGSIARGDELVGIGGTSAADLVQQFSVYQGCANAICQKTLAAQVLTYRQGFVSPNIHGGDAADVVVRKPDGSEPHVALTWTAVPHVLPPTAAPPADGTAHAPMGVVQLPQAATGQAMGAITPQVITPEVTATYQLNPVQLSAAALAHVNATVASSQKYRAYTYSYAGKHFLLVRIPDFEPIANTTIEDSSAYLRALLAEQQPLVDGLALDITHNPGGQIQLSMDLAAILARQPIQNLVQAWHADRKAISEFVDQANQLRAAAANASESPQANQMAGYASQIDDAYSSGVQLATPVPFGLDTELQPDASHWVKPVVVLIDELTISAGDMLAFLIKGNQIVPLFGQTTAGAGGCVESFQLTYSTHTVNVSRGLVSIHDPSGNYADTNILEDVGVTPDQLYTQSLADFRAGFVGYVKAFSDALVAQSH